MKIINIKWEIDGEQVDLPTEVELPENISQITDNAELEDTINNYLSDRFGWLVQNYYITK